MKVTTTAIAGLLILEPRVLGDERGFFLESYNQKIFDDALGHEVHFVQDNHSRSAKGVLRGLHYQLPPHAQGKLVRVTQGAVFDVAVDMRRSSPSFGRWVGVELSGQNHRQQGHRAQIEGQGKPTPPAPQGRPEGQMRPPHCAPEGGGALATGRHPPGAHTVPLGQ